MVIDCRLPRTYTRQYKEICSFISRIFMDLDCTLVVRIGHRWIHIRTVPKDIIEVKIPISLDVRELEKILQLIKQIITIIHKYKKQQYLISSIYLQDLLQKLEEKGSQ